MVRVMVYTLPGCVHCFRAKRRLRRKGIVFEEIEAGRDRAAVRADLRARFGADTFPQIVIGDHHIGGADQLAALDKSGELADLLSARSDLTSGPDDVGGDPGAPGAQPPARRQ